MDLSFFLHEYMKCKNLVIAAMAFVEPALTLVETKLKTRLQMIRNDLRTYLAWSTYM